MCVVSGFEYPDGYPDQERGPNNTFSLHPCPTTPSCLFQVDVQLDDGMRRVRFFQPPFEIPSHATPGRAYEPEPLPGGLACCPFTPADCCSWYDPAQRRFCDSTECRFSASQGSEGSEGSEGSASSASSAAWPCFLREFAPPPASSDHFLEQAQLDGAHLEVGSKWRSALLVLEGFLVALAGLGLYLCLRPEVRRRLDAFLQFLLRGCEHRANGLLLRFVKCLPSFLLSEGMEVLLIQDAAVVPLQRAARRWLARRRPITSMSEAVELAMVRRRSPCSRVLSPCPICQLSTSGAASWPTEKPCPALSR